MAAGSVGITCAMVARVGIVKDGGVKDSRPQAVSVVTFEVNNHPKFDYWLIYWILLSVIENKDLNGRCTHSHSSDIRQQYPSMVSMCSAADSHT